MYVLFVWFGESVLFICLCPTNNEHLHQSTEKNDRKVMDSIKSCLPSARGDKQTPSLEGSAVRATKETEECEVYIVRHGERLDEVGGPAMIQWAASLTNDGFDPPLTDQGFAQAQDAALALHRQMQSLPPFDVIFCSPLQRCVRTAEAFSALFKLPIRLVPALGECCAALVSTNRKSELRWPNLMPLKGLKNLCPTATFTEAHDSTKLNGDGARETFISKHFTCPGRLSQGKQRILIVSHRESIRMLGRTANFPDRINTTYACIAKFRCTAPGTSCEGWTYEGLLVAKHSKYKVVNHHFEKLETYGRLKEALVVSKKVHPSANGELNEDSTRTKQMDQGEGDDPHACELLITSEI